MHAILAYNGNLKLQNVLLDAATLAILVDFCLMGTNDFTAPEIMERLYGYETTFESLLTARVDIYSLSLMLCVVMEEKSRIAWPLIQQDQKTCALAQRHWTTMSCGKA
jgi:hypothetical protein